MFKDIKARIIIWTVGLTAVIGSYMLWLRFYPDILWFTDVGYQHVYIKIMVTKVLAFLLPMVLAGVFLSVNVMIARRSGAKNRQRPREINKGSIAYFLGVLRENILGGVVPGAQKEVNVTPISDSWVQGILMVVVIGLSLFFGGLAADRWPLILKAMHAVPFQKVDPIFGRDIAFYVFSLPVLLFVQRWLILLTVISLFLVGWIYFSDYVVSVVRGRIDMPDQVKRHMLILLMAFLFLLAWHFRLNMFSLVTSPQGVVYGAGYADVHAALPGLWVVTILCCVAALIALISVYAALPWSLLIGAIACTAVLWVFFNLFYVPLYQKFVVTPTELTKERPYIEHAIRHTREAYGLGAVEERDFPYTSDASKVIQNDVSFMKNLRVQDPQPLRQTLRQIQSIRTYYDFHDVDIDRYRINGEERQVLISARELYSEKIPEKGRTWINEHLKYTHGYGVAVASVAGSTTDGLPRLLVRDIPPVSTLVPIERPQIYFGEKTAPYIIVNTNTEEFDYPEGDANKYTTYDGPRGISLGSFLRRALYAVYFQDFRILFSNYIGKTAKLFYRRQVQDRVRLIAPFLSYDDDPYIVINDDGRLYWIIDAYTTANGYPYATPFTSRINYIRNSVKVVIDAYTGETTFYRFGNEPVVETYARIFPGLFKKEQDLPSGLRMHVRYPETLFRVQAAMYRLYHMTDPQVFYNQEDLWALPQTIRGGESQEMAPYYVTLKLPGADRERFLLMLPFTPNGKDNMIAWLAVGCDPDNYGKLLLYRLPKQSLVYGPKQIEARIDQDPDISKDLSLWSQKGSSVYRGNLIVVPVQNTFLYIEPIYLQATEGQIPELKRVVAASGESLAMGATLEEAMAGLLGGGRRLGTLAGQSTEAMVQEALQQYRAAKAALKKGAWSEFGRSFDMLERTLQDAGRTK